MPDIAATVKKQTALTESQFQRLKELMSEWQLLSDLSFADLILWVPLRKRYEDWPHGYIAFSHIRPTTSATLFPNEMVGERLVWGANPRIDHSLMTGEIIRDAQPEMVRELLIKEETVPVFFEGKYIAVISRHRDSHQMRSTSPLEINYREVAHKLYAMVAEGAFPIPDSFYQSESSPRVGDGLIRLNEEGEIVYASPNGRSALHHIGLSGEILSQQLGDIFDQLSDNKNIPVSENWRTRLKPDLVLRDEFENERGIVDLLTIPLLEKGVTIGAIVLIHNITDLRQRDRALISKDATIREIHHRVKNNLQTVSAILRLQSRRVADPEAREALAEAVRRVASIAIVHETLATASAQDVLFDDVINRIVHNAVELSTHPISIKRIGEFGFLESAIATPLALVITELIHNALEHGLYVAGDLLIIEVIRDAQSSTVKVIDNGIGLPEGFSWAETSNLGLQIVSTLTQNELKGSIVLNRINNQTVAELKFPLTHIGNFNSA